MSPKFVSLLCALSLTKWTLKPFWMYELTLLQSDSYPNMSPWSNFLASTRFYVFILVLTLSFTFIQWVRNAQTEILVHTLIMLEPIDEWQKELGFGLTNVQVAQGFYVVTIGLLSLISTRFLLF